MPVALDNTMLSLLLNPTCRVPVDPATNAPLTYYKERAKGLVSILQKQKQKVFIPAPAAAELLTAIGPDAQEYLHIVSRSRSFEVAPFDEKSAVELAFLNRDIFAKSDKKNRQEAYQKIKVDRQIIAICKAFGCDTLYTDDDSLTKRAKLVGLQVIPSWNLAIPIDSRQMSFELEPHDEIPEAENVDAQTSTD